MLLASGSAVPADCIVNHGSIEVDQAALTGESLPVKMHQGMSDRFPERRQQIELLPPGVVFLNHTN